MTTKTERGYGRRLDKQTRKLERIIGAQLTGYDVVE
jgi:hypothetical protein